MIYLVLLTCYGSSMVAFQSPDLDTANHQAWLLVGNEDCYVSVKESK
jgi:hypothetical protein